MGERLGYDALASVLGVEKTDRFRDRFYRKSRTPLFMRRVLPLEPETSTDGIYEIPVVRVLTVLEDEAEMMARGLRKLRRAIRRLEARAS